MSNRCVPIAIYLNKLLNNLQARPSTFVHIPKSNFFKGSCPMGLGFLGSTSPKTKVGVSKNNTGQKEPCCSGTSSDFYRWKPAREGTAGGRFWQAFNAHY
jgi:hypothetical protein